MQVLAPLLATLLGALPPATPSPGLGALAPAAIAGRLVFVDGSATVPAGDVRRRLGGRPLSVQLRSGGFVVTAPVADDGLFVADLMPGRWTVEGVAAGDAFEFVDPPRIVEGAPGELACAGQLEVAFRDLPAEFGQQTGRWSAADRCGELSARLRAAARGRRVRSRIAEESPPPAWERSGWELLAAFRASASWWVQGLGPENAGGDALTATVVLGLNQPVITGGAIGVAASLTQYATDDVPAAAGSHTSVSAGLTWDPMGGIELMAGPELHLGAGGGLGLFGQARLGTEGFGFFARVGTGGPAGRIYVYGLEIAPAWFLGGFL